MCKLSNDLTGVYNRLEIWGIARERLIEIGADWLVLFHLVTSH